MNVSLRPATTADRPVIANLIQLYLYDMTEFMPFPVGADGRFEYGFLDRFWRHPYFILQDEEIAGFALVGTPGTVGFISKWYLAVGALDKGWWFLVFLIVGSSLIALVYVGRVLEIAWLRQPTPAIAHASDPPLSMLLPLLVLAAANIYFGLDTEWTAGVAGAVAHGLLGGLR